MFFILKTMTRWDEISIRLRNNDFMPGWNLPYNQPLSLIHMKCLTAGVPDNSIECYFTKNAPARRYLLGIFLQNFLIDFCRNQRWFASHFGSVCFFYWCLMSAWSWLKFNSKYWGSIPTPPSPWTHDVNWTHIRRSENVLDVF